MNWTSTNSDPGASNVQPGVKFEHLFFSAALVIVPLVISTISERLSQRFSPDIASRQLTWYESAVAVTRSWIPRQLLLLPLVTFGLARILQYCFQRVGQLDPRLFGLESLVLGLGSWHLVAFETITRSNVHYLATAPIRTMLSGIISGIGSRLELWMSSG